MPQVSFTQMRDGTYDDYQIVHAYESEYIEGLPDRLLTALKELDSGMGGYKVTRLEHSLQSASRAEDDGADVEYIVAALLHDIGDALAPQNH